jgi:hypothetical protein
LDHARHGVVSERRQPGSMRTGTASSGTRGLREHASTRSVTGARRRSSARAG